MLNLNIGCGEYHADGWLNIDLHDKDMRHPDIEMDCTKELPGEIGTVDRIYAGHVLEHIAFEDVPAALNLWWEYARPGCELFVVGPDCDRGDEWVRRGKLTSAEGLKITKHYSDTPGRSHLWNASESNTLALLNDSLWSHPRAMPIVSVPNTWPVTSRIGWQFAVLSTKDS